MSISARDLLGDYVRLSEKQYYAARVAGYTEADLFAKTNAWYNANRSSIVSDRTDKSKDAPALFQQLKYLESKDIDVETDLAIYDAMRHVIVNIILTEATDERFIAIYEKYIENNKIRVEQRRFKKVSAKPKTELTNEQTEYTEFFENLRQIKPTK